MQLRFLQYRSTSVWIAASRQAVVRIGTVCLSRRGAAVLNRDKRVIPQDLAELVAWLHRIFALR